MDASDLDHSFDDNELDELDQQYSEENFHNHHIRDAFINGAFDRDLAYCIFQTISFGKGSCALQSMKIGVTGAGYHSRDDRGFFIPGWPPKTDNWWEKWHSLPLAVSGDVS